MSAYFTPFVGKFVGGKRKERGPMKLTLTKIKTLPIGKKISDGQGLCLTKTAPNKGMRFSELVKELGSPTILGLEPGAAIKK